MKQVKANRWMKTKADVFWGEIAPCNHILQIYENDEVFIETLAGFVGTGIKSGDCSIVIATRSHLDQLEEKLLSKGFNTQLLTENESYIPLDAEEILASFMVDGWPVKELFQKTVSTIVERAHCRNRPVRAFGEMVAILWAQGNCGATVQLEALWNDYMHTQDFSLFCAYPMSGFTEDINVSIDKICCQHSKILANTTENMSEIIYKDLATMQA